MMKATGWGNDRFQKAKQYLVSSNTIEPIARRDDKWVIVGHFIRVMFDLSKGLECPQPWIPTTGEPPLLEKQHTNTIVENNINTIIEKEKEETKVSKPSYIPKPIDIIISSLKEQIKKDGYIYSNIKERMFGMHLSKNAEWNEACLTYKMTPEQLIVYIMTYANSKWCWYIGKICSVQSFYYKWAVLLSEMKTKGVQAPNNTKPDEAKKKEALDFFNDI